VVILVLGALALVRAVADLVASLMLRETGPASNRPREKAAGLAGYAAGLADFAAAATARSGRPRHRATGLLGARSAGSAAATPDIRDAVVREDDGVMAESTTGDRAMADLDAMLALAGVSGAVTSAQPALGASMTPAQPAVGGGGDDGMVAATMFTGPHHADGRLQDSGPQDGGGRDGGGRDGSAHDGGGRDGDRMTAGPGPAGGAPAAAASMGAGAGEADARSHTGRRSATRSGSTAARPDRTTGDGAPDGDAAPRGGSLAERTARLFSRVRRDTR
jgi:hypothetical protein